MKRYRIEIFNRQTLGFKSFAEVSEPDIYVDALVSSESTIQCIGELDGNRGDFAQIRIDGKVYYQGIVTDLTYDSNKTEVKLRQLEELLNVEVFADVSLLSGQTIETWFSNLLTSTFNGTDTYQNLPGFAVSSSSSTTGSYEASDKGIYNLYDLAVFFFKNYGVILEVSFDVSTTSVKFKFRAVSNSVLKLDLQVTDISSYEIENSTSADSPNKVIVMNEDDNSETLTYYWHPTDFSGTIDTDASTDRVVPVVVRCETAKAGTGTTFAQESYARAEQILYSTRYDDLIRVTIKAESNLISTWQIGQLFTLYDNGSSYNTILTGIHTINMLYVELTFGYVRTRLTQILKMKGV